MEEINSTFKYVVVLKEMVKISISEVKVSIIVPVYNSEKFLVQNIDSIIRQTHKSLEIIFINDGSSDKSLDILEEYSKKDNRIKIISIENSGPAKARNIGIDHATGKYICFFDSDDYIEPDMIESLLKVAESKNADLIVCGYFIEKMKNDKLVKTQVKLPSNNCLNTKNKSDLFAQLYKEDLVNTLWNKMFKLEVIENNNIKMDESLFYSEDFNFVIDCFKYIKSIAVIDKPYYHLVRRNINSLSKKYHHNQELIFEKIIKNMESLFSKIGCTSNSQEIINRRRAQKAVICIWNLFHSDCPLSIKNKQEKIEKIMDEKTLEAIKAIKPQGRLQRLVFPVLRTSNTWLIYFSFKLLRLIYSKF